MQRPWQPGCDNKLTQKTEIYCPLIAALEKYWGRVEFVAIPIGHAGTTLHRNIEHRTSTLSTARPHHVEQPRANTGIADPAMDSSERSHDYRLFKSL